MSGEAMTLSVINKINENVKFFSRKNRYFTPFVSQLLCNALIRLHFDNVCSAWYFNLTKKIEKYNPDHSEQMDMFLPTAR